MPNNQPPVEVIQGEARAREVLASIHESLGDQTTAARIRNVAAPLAEHERAHVDMLLAFQSEARAGDEEERGGKYRVLRENLDRDIERTGKFESFMIRSGLLRDILNDLDAKSLPLPDREAIARVILPLVRAGMHDRWEDDCQETALTFADAILSLTPSAGRDGSGREDIPAMAQFLCDRLDNLDWQDFEDTTRDFMGHVDPALSRLKSALASQSE